MAIDLYAVNSGFLVRILHSKIPESPFYPKYPNPKTSVYEI